MTEFKVLIIGYGNRFNKRRLYQIYGINFIFATLKVDYSKNMIFLKKIIKY